MRQEAQDPISSECGGATLRLPLTTTMKNKHPSWPASRSGPSLSTYIAETLRRELSCLYGRCGLVHTRSSLGCRHAWGFASDQATGLTRGELKGELGELSMGRRSPGPATLNSKDDADAPEGEGEFCELLLELDLEPTVAPLEDGIEEGNEVEDAGLGLSMMSLNETLRVWLLLGKEAA